MVQPSNISPTRKKLVSYKYFFQLDLIFVEKARSLLKWSKRKGPHSGRFRSYWQMPDKAGKAFRGRRSFRPSTPTRWSSCLSSSSWDPESWRRPKRKPETTRPEIWSKCYKTFCLLSPTTRSIKLECFCMEILSSQVLEFEGKARANPIGVPFRCFLLG